MNLTLVNNSGGSGGSSCEEIEIRRRDTYIRASFLPGATLLNPSLHA
jgi:hypothetical protein